MSSSCHSKEALALLGLKAGATRREVESAFRRKALRCHPDRHPKDPLAKARFQRLSRAKETLLQCVSTTPSAASCSAEAKKPKGTTSRPTDRATRARRVAEERRRQEAEERLRQREAAAREEKQRRKEAEAEAAVRRKAALAEEQRRERLAAAERRRAEIFDAWRQRRLKPASSQASAASGDPSARVASKHDISRSYSPQPKEVERPESQASSLDAKLDERQRKALKRLKLRRQSGEGLVQLPQGSWWVHDDEAERYMRREELYGFT